MWKSLVFFWLAIVPKLLFAQSVELASDAGSSAVADDPYAELSDPSNGTPVDETDRAEIGNVFDLILVLKDRWRDDACESTPGEWCIRMRDDGQKLARELAGYIWQECKRFDLPVELVVSIIYRESSFQVEPCRLRIDVELIKTRVSAGERGGDPMEVITWRSERRTDPETGDPLEYTRTLRILREQEDELHCTRCSADEVGLGQITLNNIEAGVDTIVPATGLSLGRDPEEDAVCRAYDREGCSEHSDDCRRVDNECRAHTMSYEERWQQVLDPLTNISLLCKALDSIRDDSGERSSDNWYDWVWRYNGSRLYSDRIRYTFCKFDEDDELCTNQR